MDRYPVDDNAYDPAGDQLEKDLERDLRLDRIAEKADCENGREAWQAMARARGGYWLADDQDIW